MTANLTISQLQKACHEASYQAGWWHHPNSGLPYIPGDAPLPNTVHLKSSLVGGKPIYANSWASLDPNTRAMIIHYWPFVLATKVGLIHSEVSEGLEALQKNLMDDKLPHRLGLETELADSMIRTFDIGGAVNRARKFGVVVMPAAFDLGAALTEKMAFNADRPDHKVTARTGLGGKVF